jgi:AraC-like DNA-binding protein
MPRLPRVLSAGASLAPHQVPTRPHRHPGSEVIALHQGVAQVVVGGTAYRLDAEHLLRLPAGTVHDQTNLEPVRQTYAVLDLADLPAPPEPERIACAPQDPVRRWLDDLVQLHAAGLDHSTEGALVTAISARLDYLAGRAVAPARPLPAPLAALLRHLDADPLTSHDEAALARLAGVSSSHLRHLTRGHLGMSPSELQRQARLRLAQRLLCTSTLAIADVAAACGWEDANHFARVFRRRTGLTPRAFRTAYRQR